MVTRVTNTVIANNTVHLRHLHQEVIDAMATGGSGAEGNANAVQANLTALISGATQFTVPKTFQSDLTVQGNLFVEGDQFIANVITLTVEDRDIIINHNGTHGRANGASFQVEGTGGVIIGALVFDNSAPSSWTIGTSNTGLSSSLDAVARVRDYQANDFLTFDAARSNDYTTLISAYANDLVTYNSAKANDFTTWESGKSNDYSTLLAAYANDYATYIALLGGGGGGLIPKHNTNTATGTSNVFFLSMGGNVVSAVTRIQLYLDGLDQWPTTDFIYNSGNDTVQVTDAIVPAGTNVHILAWTT